MDEFIENEIVVMKYLNGSTTKMIFIGYDTDGFVKLKPLYFSCAYPFLIHKDKISKYNDKA
jgi:hypothetical protein